MGFFASIISSISPSIVKPQKYITWRRTPMHHPNLELKQHRPRHGYGQGHGNGHDRGRSNIYKYIYINVHI